MEVFNNKTLKMAELYMNLFSKFQIVKVKRVYIVQYCIFLYDLTSFGHHKTITSAKAQVFYVGSEQPASLAVAGSCPRGLPHRKARPDK